jgi:guanylate kinase
MKGIPFIISSPSGGGKGTLIREVLKTTPNIGYSISFTTRAPRAGEQNGREYNFVSRKEFENLIGAGAMLEHAEVHGRYYGTSREQVERETTAGRDVILEIDVQGAEIVTEKLPESISVFILPPSFQVLKERLAARGTEDSSDLEVRLRNSFSEVSQYEDFDYIIVNDEVTRAANDLRSVITAERLRRSRQLENIARVLQTFDR